MHRKSRFRPTVDSLEGRRLMAADAGLADTDATPEEPAQVATITDITISGNTANVGGGYLKLGDIAGESVEPQSAAIDQAITELAAEGTSSTTDRHDNWIIIESMSSPIFR